MNIIDEIIPEKNSATRRNVRIIIPVLIKWAMQRKSDKVYEDLNSYLGYKKCSKIGYFLKEVQKVIEELSKRKGIEIPTLNGLIQSKTKGIPSSGLECACPEYNVKYKNDNEKRIFVEGLKQVAFNFRGWDWVLKELELEPAKSFTENEISDIMKNKPISFGKGEGEEHKALKEYIFNNPEIINIKHKNIVEKQMEYQLPSGDRLDIYFVLSDDTRIAIEVKPSISPEQDIMRGIFQCVKYEAVLNAIKTLECKTYDVKSLLVTSSKFSELNKSLAKELSVKYIECLGVSL